MAEFADAAATDPEDHARLYTAIEKAYVDDRWADVLEQGQALLTSLEADDLELRQRLQLLMAHTHLYGYGDRDAAEDLYHAVLASEAEPSLRQIADQGLQQCNRPLQREPQSARTEQPVATATPATTPKLDPEQLPQPVAAPLEDGDGSSLHESLAAMGMAMGTANQPGRPPGTTAAAVEPVMPWLSLEKGEPTRPVESPVVLSGEGNGPGARDIPVGTEPLSAEPMGIEAIAAEPVASETNAPAAFDAASATATRAMEAQDRASGLDSTGADSFSQVPDVIEEPELIEVHQADPSLAEEYELLETGALAEIPAMELPADAGIPMEDPGFEEDPELMEGLLRVVIR